MGDVARLKDGRYAAFFHDDGRFFKNGEDPGPGHKFRVYQILSDDGGLSWGEPRVIASHPRVHLCEPGFVRSPDGQTIALLLRENSRKRNSFVVTSQDEASTWSEPRELPAALTGDRHQAVYTDDGRLFISFRDTTRESATQGDWVAWVGRFEDIIKGREGQYRVRLMDNKHRWDCAYPALAKLPDGGIVCTTYGHWTKDEKPWIASLRIRVEELDERLKGQSSSR